MNGHQKLAYVSNPEAKLGNVTEKCPKYAKGGGIKIKRPGALTKKAKAAGEGVQEFATEHESDSGLTGKQARFAKAAAKWHHGK